jgi:hypothetical protein
MSEEKKTGIPFSLVNKKTLVSTNVYTRLDSNGLWVSLTEAEFKDISDEYKSDYEKHSLKFIRPWWNLSVWVDDLGSTFNDLGMRVNDPVRNLESTVRYYLKETSMFDLEFEKDTKGFNRISDECWSNLTSEEGIPPQIMTCIYRAYRELSIL